MALVLAGLAAVSVVRDRDKPPQRSATQQGTRGEPGEYPSSSPTRSGPLPVFPGMTPSTVMDAWAGRWPVPVTVDGSLHIIKVTLPGKQGQLSAAVGQPSKDRKNEVAQVLCMVKLAGAVQRQLLQTLVDGCIGPVLGAKERRAVLDWLIGVDFSAPTYEFRRTSGYELLANHNSDENFALNLFAR
ncbi:hypothetical protein AB0B39_03095 [Micromonospora sp. NPDC049114]|uniref:hypothetical protein n=1 Tax=unclassified Micromonospora TaxID=2617518 RepID=UPI0033D8236C